MPAITSVTFSDSVPNNYTVDVITPQQSETTPARWARRASTVPYAGQLKLSQSIRKTGNGAHKLRLKMEVPKWDPTEEKNIHTGIFSGEWVFPDSMTSQERKDFYEMVRTAVTQALLADSAENLELIY